jgi:hypothetical protein
MQRLHAPTALHNLKAPAGSYDIHFSFGSWSCENSSALRKRRNISVKLGIMKPNHPAHIWLNTVLENCIFYISTMYEFSHRVGQNEKVSRRAFLDRCTPESGRGFDRGKRQLRADCVAKV